MNLESDSGKLVIADRRVDASGKPTAFLLRNRQEEVALEPGKSWAQIDTFKWVTRGLMDEPSGFHVLPDGAVELHGEHIGLGDRDGVAHLEAKINQHLSAPAPKPAQPTILKQTARPASNKVTFKVRLDRLGHLMVTSIRGAEKVETGIRGLEGLVRNGLMLKPKEVHLDPLLAYVEIDGSRFESNEAGAEALENRLNGEYAPVIKSDGHAAVEVKANSAAASGFDIHFYTVRAGARFEIKGHLSQEHLETLQDSNKCELLRPGTILRLSPPQLIIRRRRPDGGEERIPELPDVNYLRITAAELQKLLNHPVIRRDGGGAASEPAEEHRSPDEITALRLHRSLVNKTILTLEVVSTSGSHSKAFTHHNIVELQRAGAFRPNLHVTLSLDNRALSILDSQTSQDDRIMVDDSSTDADLEKASQMLTAALNPAAGSGNRKQEQVLSEPIIAPAPPPAPAEEPKIEALSTSLPQAEEAKIEQPILVVEEPAEPMAQEIYNPELRALFESEADGTRVNIEIFRRLEQCLGRAAQRVQLSLDRVFQDRPFEIISFTHSEISDILDIHSEEFAGFYLSHINERKVILDYAWHGKRIEWGPQKCWVRAGVRADPEEFGSRALLGMALLEDSHFVFVVTPEFKRWIAPREKTYIETAASFMTVDELACSADAYPLVWPVPLD